jgi:hypothetical protein
MHDPIFLCYRLLRVARHPPKVAATAFGKILAASGSGLVMVL